MAETIPPPGDRIPPSPEPPRPAIPEDGQGGARVVRRRVRRRFGWFGRREETAEAIDDDTEPQDPDRHGWADLLALVGDLRRLAYDRSLATDDAMRRIRDRFGVYDGTIRDESDG